MVVHQDTVGYHLLYGYLKDRLVLNVMSCYYVRSAHPRIVLQVAVDNDWLTSEKL